MSSIKHGSMDIAGQVSNLTQPNSLCCTNDDKCNQPNQEIDELLRPRKLDWAEDVEEELLSMQLAGQVRDFIHSNDVWRTNEDGYHQIDSQIDELLKPVQFDWADDVEAGLALPGQAQADSFENLPIESHPPVDQPEKGRVPDECPMADRLPLSDFSPLDPVGDTGNNSEPESSSGGTKDPSIPESSPCTTMENSSFDNGFAEAAFQVSREFVSRALMVDMADSIHHFNWRGSPVYEYSSTPPAISLLYLLSDPKVPKQSDELRFQSILTRATIYIDPVLVALDGGWDDLNTKGFELVRFATGRTSKFYTPHGKWIHDNKEKNDQTILDDGDIYIYIFF